MDKKQRTIRLHTKYKTFYGDMKNIWEEYSYLAHYIYGAKTEEFELKSLVSINKGIKTKGNAGGMQNRFKQGGNTRTHYIDAISVFENYIASLVEFVYLDYPSKMNGGGMDEKKLFMLVINSEDKEAIITSIIEEKVRSIFYGNPVEIFSKDKCKLELGNSFEGHYKEALVLYREIVGRRNIIIHNSGRIDKKYLRENRESGFSEGHKIIISEDYLRGTIGLLMGIAAITTISVVEKIYKGDCRGKIADAGLVFDRCINNDWYKKLLSN